jgi:hypothetical protein
MEVGLDGWALAGQGALLFSFSFLKRKTREMREGV